MGRWVNLGEYLCCGGQKTAELHNSPVVLYILSEGKIADFYGFCQTAQFPAQSVQSDHAGKSQAKNGPKFG